MVEGAETRAGDNNALDGRANFAELAGHVEQAECLAEAGMIEVDWVNPLGIDMQGAYRLPIPKAARLSRLRPCCRTAVWSRCYTTCSR